jgi:hypothetical protein
LRNIKIIRVMLVIKNKINMSYLKILYMLYMLEWSWSLTPVSNQFFKYTSISKVWYVEVIIHATCVCACLDVSKLFIYWLCTFNNTARVIREHVTCRHKHLFVSVFTRAYIRIWHIYHCLMHEIWEKGWEIKWTLEESR